MNTPNSAFWPRIAVTVLIFSAVSHITMFMLDQPPTFHFFNIVFIILTCIHYFLTLGVVKGDRQSRWIAVLLATTYVLTMDATINRIVMAVANLLFLEPYWSLAWTRQTSQT